MQRSFNRLDDGRYWAVDVRKKGLYTIELRRWPAETGFAISAGIDGDDVPWNRKLSFIRRLVSEYIMSSGCTSRH